MKFNEQYAELTKENRMTNPNVPPIEAITIPMKSYSEYSSDNYFGRLGSDKRIKSNDASLIPTSFGHGNLV